MSRHAELNEASHAKTRRREGHHQLSSHWRLRVFASSREPDDFSRTTVQSAALIVALLILFACRGRAPVVVGSKNFTESVILGELVAQKLESAGCRVDRRLNLGGSFVCDTALASGSIDAYVEYSGTALTAIFKRPASRDRAEIDRTLAAEYAKRTLHWGPALGFNNTFAMIVRGDDARSLGLRTISDLRRFQDRLQPGFGYEFVARLDGWDGLQRAYDLHFAKPPRTMDLGLTYKALISNGVDLIAGDATNGLNASLGLVTLEDDRHFFPTYDAAIVRRDDIDAKCSAAATALASLSHTIDETTMRRINFEVDGKKRDVAEVVRELLAGSGNVGPSSAGQRREAAH
ncbi:MAG TPA: glycine betaine ABC transporter substrate-binding protein [Thermoanaerobaculia bacterium]|nr:glycine betaine ABC transporter substrate-binding protein [Thermoanaerobaculia bacterium]